MTRTCFVLTLIIFLLSSSLRWQNLAYIPEQVFDEVHYVNAAEVMVGVKTHPGMGVWANHPQLGKAPAPNFEHPLLGKFLIGWGIKLFGDNAWGWRFFSCVFGTLSTLFLSLLAWQFFKKIDTEHLIRSIIVLGIQYYYNYPCLCLCFGFFLQIT